MIIIGEIRENTKGTKMIIIAERNGQDIDVEFLDGHHYIKEHTTYVNFKRGEIKNPFDATVNNFGYTGAGKHPASENGNKLTQLYLKWKNIINRCTDDLEMHANYKDCIVCEEWKNFQNFAEWYENHYYDIGQERLHVDKDIKYHGNKVYSPYHCILVPQSVNEVFKENFGRSKKVDADLPYTIKRCTTGYSVSYRSKSLGVYKTVDEAINIYLKAKQNWVIEVIDKYVNIPDDIKNIVIESAGKHTIK